MDIYDYAVLNAVGDLSGLYAGYTGKLTSLAYTYVYLSQNKLILEPKHYQSSQIDFWNKNNIDVNQAHELLIAKSAIDELPQLYFATFTYDYISGIRYPKLYKMFPIYLEYAGYFYRDDVMNSNPDSHHWYREIYYKVNCDDENKPYLGFTTKSNAFQSNGNSILTEYGKEYIEKYINADVLTTTDISTGDWVGVRAIDNSDSVTVPNFYTHIKPYVDRTYSPDIIEQYPLKLWGVVNTRKNRPLGTWIWNLIYSPANSRYPIDSKANKYYFAGRWSANNGISQNLYTPGVKYVLNHFIKPEMVTPSTAMRTIESEFTATSLVENDIVLVPYGDTALIKNPDDYLNIKSNVRYSDIYPPKPNTCRQVFTTTNAKNAKVNGRIYTANAKKSLINPYDENAKTGGGCGSYGD